MNRLVRSVVALGGTLLLGVGLASQTAAAGDGMRVRDVLTFNTAFANVAPFIGDKGKIRDVTAAPLPWAIKSIHGDLDSNGRLNVEVTHLVLANDPMVPASLRGTNPVPFFAAIVSCQTASNGAMVTRNVTTGNFPATAGGNASIHQRLTLPRPCAAPDVFVTSPNGGVWFAATGSAGTAAFRDILDFHTAFANVSPFIDGNGIITGVTAAPFPWMVRSEVGDLDVSGRLNIDVDGLVLANDPLVPAGLRGTNPVPAFAAVVTCRTDVNGTVQAVRVTSPNFPATTTGNAEIHASLSLPHPCVTPYVFVTSPKNVTSPNAVVWFSVTGR